jgi:DNA-binding MarR family transcriptional regulator
MESVAQRAGSAERATDARTVPPAAGVVTAGPAVDAIRAIRSWLRLEQAFAAFNRELRATVGLTGAQLAMLRILHEVGPVTLAELRGRLRLHPATLGQLVDRLKEKSMVTLSADPTDGRRRIVELTAEGRRALHDAPLAGPVRLRSVQADPARLATLADALDDAVELFGLQRWASR